MSPSDNLPDKEFYAAHLYESLALACAPREVLNEVVLRDQRKIHPPQPGWDLPPGPGLIRIWTDRDLLRWYDLGSDQDLFGPLDRVTLALRHDAVFLSAGWTRVVDSMTVTYAPPAGATPAEIAETEDAARRVRVRDGWVSEQ